MPPLTRALFCLVLVGLTMPALASGPPIVKPEAEAAAEKELTPEQKMQKRFPHPVRVGDLIGLPVLDDDD